jgi:Ca-activated chloride channel family protein
MTVTVTRLDAPPAPSEDDGFGALTTDKGNLPLEALDVRIATTGLASHTVLTQRFHNPYEEPLEATYVFPLPDRAALTSLRMTADDREIDGVLREREQARQEYDQAISEGKRASIAEEERPGVFTMRVGNILPGERVSIRLTLAGRLAYEDGLATLRFPLVVAPRYIPGTPLPGGSVGSGVEPDTDAVPDASRITPPVLLPGCPNPVALSIEAELDPAGLPLAGVESSLHTVAVDDLDDGRLRVRVHPGERVDRDFVLRLRLGSPDAITSSLALAPDERTEVPADFGSGSFVLTMLPPSETGKPRPRDVVFVLDRSGSMGGWKMVAARRATARIVDTLGSADRFTVLAFDNVIEPPPHLPKGLIEGTDRHRFRAIEHLAKLEARGGTEMLRPLLEAADLLSADDGTGRERALVLITDGQVGNEDQILRDLAPKLRGVRIHTVGIDVAVNEAFLRRLAALGGGHYELVESEDRLDQAMEAIHRRIGTPLVTDLRVEAEGLDLVPGTLAPAPLPGLYAGAPLVVTGRYQGKPDGALRVAGARAGAAEWSNRLPAEVSASSALGAVWARARLRDLEDHYVIGGRDDVDALERQIVATSLAFGVLCRFTAYVAVDSRVVTEGGTPRRVTQPVELPQSWELPSMPPAPMAAAMPMSFAGGVARSAAAPAGGLRQRRGAVESGVNLSMTDRDGSAMDWRADEQLRAPASSFVHEEAARLRARLRAATGEDVRGVLEELLAWLADVGQFGLDPAQSRPLNELAADLATLPSEPAELERLRLRAVDVLTAFLGDGGSTPPPAPAPETPRRKSFWRRG